MEHFEQLLGVSGGRMTAPRRAIFTALEQAGRPISLQQLSARVDVDRTSIYRTLELFTRLGIIEILYTGWKKSYELADPFKPHHHHLQCTQCSRLVELDAPRLERLIDQLADARGYRLTSHHIELRGLCPNCL